MVVTVKTATKPKKSNVTVVKVKASVKDASTIVVDRVVELRKQIDAMKPVSDEYNKLVKQLREQAMEKDPEQVVSFEGSDTTIVFGEAAKTRELTDIPGAKKALGTEVFNKVATITLGDLDKYLTPEELAPLIKEGRGARKIDFVAK